VNNPTVSLTQVTRRYGSATVLDCLDLDLSPGITGLLGPNGAGKTTLLRILATVLAPTSGSCRTLGRDPDDPDQRTEIRRRLGYLPQESGYPRGFTAFRYVDYVAALKEWTERGSRHAEVRRALELVGLTDLAGKRMRTLSGGQRRRAALAQALLGHPELLVLDEPTTGLDPEQRASLRGVLSAAGHRSTVVLATHQTEDVAALCERVIVLDGGRVLWDGPVTALVGTAAGKVWLADVEQPAALSSWRTGTGRYRHVALDPPPGVELAEPSLEDAYLLLRAAAGSERDGVSA
jgi:ABC-2 type transport system ATP-binding protein